MNKYLYEAVRYSVLVVRNKEGKFLCVKETDNKGWWLPGGKVQLGETFLKAALRQCVEQTLIKPEIKGIIRIDYGAYAKKNCLRCIYYAQPVDLNQKPKNQQDQHTSKAEFLTIQQILGLRKQWRGSEIYQFPKYIQDGKQVHSLSVFAENFGQLEQKI